MTPLTRTQEAFLKAILILIPLTAMAQAFFNLNN